MKNFSISLKERYEVQGGYLQCAIVECLSNGENSSLKRPAVIVIPGGGYLHCSQHEGEPVAKFFQAKGFQTFILYYQNKPQGARYPEQLIEAGVAVDYVKRNADALWVNAEEVFVVGFSAGGHLAGNLAVEYATVGEKAGMELDARPTAVALGYPVISSKAGHIGSHRNLLEGYTDKEKRELCKILDLDEAVTEKTVPAFIWTTAMDDVVPSENALLFALALARHKIRYELHVTRREDTVYPSVTQRFAAKIIRFCKRIEHGWTIA